MPDIKVLDTHVADLIAAGEVVERPASVAKELLENAIDAGATAVTVEIAHGGMTFLRVSDNGCGIPADQLSTAFLRHATSKLRTQYDLEAIGTLGFRGEALAAISAVSRIDVMSRTQDAPLGASLALEGGVPGRVEEAGCPLGTTIVVRDLFFNTPARLKFMKRDSAEGAAVFAAVQHTALSHPEVSVKFIRDGKQELLTPGDGQLKSSVYAVLGREIALGLLPVQGSGEEMEVTGFASLPTCCRGSRSCQYFFVNGRQIKSRLMMAALEEAYKNQKMVGKFPACVLHLQMKLNAVDVNVHPAKTEVKFGSERRVFDAVYHAVLSALERDRSRPSAAPDRPAPHDTVSTNQIKLGNPAPQPLRTQLPLRDAARVRTPVQEKKFSTEQVKYVEKIPEQPEKAELPPLNPPEKAEKEKKPLQVSHRPVDILWEEPPKPAPQPEPVPETPAPKAEPEPREVSTASAEIVEESQPETEPWRVAGEVFHTYILVEQGEKLLFIDKHAAHERMNFDRMKAQDYQPMVQTLLVPLTLHPSAQEGEVLLSHLPLLEEFGFGVEDFGGGALIVRQAPFDVDPGDVENTLLEIAQKLLSTGRADPSAARDELLHTMACKAAIKGGWKSGPQELERVAQAVMSGQVRYCPHGRPVAVEMTEKQLEKLFKRI